MGERLGHKGFINPRGIDLPHRGNMSKVEVLPFRTVEWEVFLKWATHHFAPSEGLATKTREPSSSHKKPEPPFQKVWPAGRSSGPSQASHAPTTLLERPPQRASCKSSSEGVGPVNLLYTGPQEACAPLGPEGSPDPFIPTGSPGPKPKAKNSKS